MKTRDGRQCLLATWSLTDAGRGQGAKIGRQKIKFHPFKADVEMCANAPAVMTMEGIINQLNEAYECKDLSIMH
jgi:hypothetical protein